MNNRPNHYAEFKDGYWYLRCEAPADSFCHANYPCGCEFYSEQRINSDGNPEHLGHGDEWHAGEFAPKRCTYIEWFSFSDPEALVGAVRVPVIPEWEGDFYNFRLHPKETP